MSGLKHFMYVSLQGRGSLRTQNRFEGSGLFSGKRYGTDCPSEPPGGTKFCTPGPCELSDTKLLLYKLTGVRSLVMAALGN